MGERYRDGKYLAAGRWYSETDLFGYPDSLIRARTSFAYQAGCELIRNSTHTSTIADIGSCHGHGVATIQKLLQPDMVLSLDRWYDFLVAQSHVIQPSPDYVTMNLPNIPLGNVSCDALFLIHVIEHLPNPDVHLRELYRVLKPGGKLVVATPNEKNIVWLNPDDKHLYNQQSFKDLLEQTGFATEVYSVTADDHALKVHQRKKAFSRYFPYTQKLRKYISWQLWDKFLLAGQLTNDDFHLELDESKSGIDLLAIASKK